jgi:hypothetical protein
MFADLKLVYDDYSIALNREIHNYLKFKTLEKTFIQFLFFLTRLNLFKKKFCNKSSSKFDPEYFNNIIFYALLEYFNRILKKNIINKHKHRKKVFFKF